MGSELKKIVNALDKILPKSMIEEGDNSGLILGDIHKDIKHIYIALEATKEVIDNAIRVGADLLIVHHPLIYMPIRAITTDTAEGSKIRRILQSDMALYVAHSNLDRIESGLNHFFGKWIGLDNIRSCECFTDGYILKGDLEESISLEEFCKKLGKKLEEPFIRFVGSPLKKIKTIGFCTGSGMSLIKKSLFYEIDVYLTGDLKYHDAMWVYEEEEAVIDITHFKSERIVTSILEELVGSVVSEDIEITKDVVIVSPINYIRINS